MRYYLYLLIVAMCETRRITRGIHHPHFPNFRSVYHGHGATSYQNVQIDNHDSIPVPTNYIDQVEVQDLEHHSYHQPEIIPIVESHDDIDHIDIADSVPYEEFLIDDVALASDILEHYYNQYDEEHEFDTHI